MTKQTGNQNNRANQLNTNNAAYQGSRAGSGHSKPALDNRANQLNTNHAPSKSPQPQAGTGGAQTPKQAS